MSQIFDPLGWLAPVIIYGKLFIQGLWKPEFDWDTILPGCVQQKWLAYRNSLPSLEQVRIRRCIIPRQSTQLSLVGFCDASEKAYAAVVYICAYFDTSAPCISLITSKTRVAPTKQIALPRLELWGAVLLSQLMTTVKGALKMDFDSISAWTDSTVTLASIKAHPSRWKTYVANRVTEIQSNIPANCWGHVSSANNPADCSSRGIEASELISHTLWWNGPAWLQVHTFPTSYPVNQIETDEKAILLEEKRVVISACVSVQRLYLHLLHRFSSLNTAIRVTAWTLRFVHNCSINRLKLQKKIHAVRDGPLTPIELNLALILLVKEVQSKEFHHGIQSLQRANQVHSRSKILSLCPFLDMNGVLKVGGRLRHSSLPQDQKNPIVLPRHHRFTELLIMSKHLQHFHAGPQLLASIIHQQFWIIRARDAIRHQLKRCVVCTRYAAVTQQQLMGDLPSARVVPSRPFAKCGVDYAGPFVIKANFGRSKVTCKAYLSIFVCFVTRAIHLEVVSDLSTDAFLAALRRFISRRGKPSDILSDCGTNFIGAAREIKEMLALVKSLVHNTRVADSVSSDGIVWKFNPPGAPHFGGLWEAGVKSVKFHLHRVMGAARLNFEELTTMMCQIEACLNSRPLTPTSSDPNDLTALTPGHFLIAAPLTSLPEPDITAVKTGRLDRWQLIQQMQQLFWKRWSNEFISRLQQRPKWMQQRTQVRLNDMVLIKDENLPPLKWKLGRVIALHPGADGISRVATLRTSQGEFKRPIVKICLLPIDNSNDTVQ